MDISLLINPWVVSTVLGLVLSAALILLLWRCASMIGAWLKAAHEKVFTRTGFFWMVNITFMAVSILHGGVFFGLTGGGKSAHDVPGTQFLGFAVSFFLDLVTIILMQAMLEARHRGEDQRATQFLFFIAVCCGTSTFANLAIDLNNFNAAVALPNAPWWVQDAAPYVLASFPLFVIMTSIAAELIINIRPMDKLDEKTFESDEKKRIRMYEIRNQYLAKQVAAELEMQVIRAKRRANKAMQKGKLPGGFRWPWEKPIEVDVLIAGVSRQLESIYALKIEALTEQHNHFIEEMKELKLAANSMSLPGAKVAKPVVTKSLRSAVSSGGKSADLGTEKTPVVERLNGANVSPSDGGTVGVSQTAKTDETEGRDTDGNLSSINDAAASLDVASLDLAPDVAEVVSRYPLVYLRWLARDEKSASIDEIVEVTKQSKRRVQYQVGKALKRTSRNDNRILVSSIIKWLRTVPLPEQVAVHFVAQNGNDTAVASDQNGGTSSRSDSETVNDIYSDLLPSSSDEETDKLAISLAALRDNPGIDDGELARKLGLKRSASARFWRVKAREVLELEQELVEQSAELVNA